MQKHVNLFESLDGCSVHIHTTASNAFETALLCSVLKFPALVPFDNTMIIKNMLSSKEKAWINEYHEDVFEKINKFLTRNERSYLRKLCLKIN